VDELGRIANGHGLTIEPVSHHLAGTTRIRGARCSRLAGRDTASPQHGTLGGNLCLDTRCNYYDQNHEWRKSIDFA
jgi:4-hydroxybenzoyl-CoA reductase subunit beta